MSVLRKFVKPRETPAPRCTAVIVAAGASVRMGTDKILSDIGGMPVIARTVAVFDKSEYISEIIVVARQDSLVQIADICKQYGFQKVSKVVCGGKTRAESALAGVSEVSERTKLIAIHDGARPLVTVDLIARTIAAAAEHIAAAPGISPTDTVKLVNENCVVEGTVDRDAVVLMQTPQVFDANLVKGALTRAVQTGMKITDDCSAVEAMGVSVFVVPGEEDNIKLTTPRDIFLAERILTDRGEYV